MISIAKPFRAIASLFALISIILSAAPPKVAQPEPASQTVTPVQQVAEPALVGKIEVKVLKPGEPSPTAVKVLDTAAVVELQPVTVGVKTVSALLQENKIKPDPYSYSLVMDLNPELENINSLQTGQQIVLPTIDRSALPPSVDDDNRVAFAIKPRFEKRIALALKVADINTLQLKLGTANFEDEAVRADFNTALSKSIKALGALKNLPVNSQTLESIVDEDAETISSVLKMAAENRPITKALAEAVSLTSDTLVTLETKAKNGKNIKNVNVLISTLRFEDDRSTEVRGLSIRYRLQGPFITDEDRRSRGEDIDPYREGASMPFPGLSSPVAEDLRETVYYCFWAVRERDGVRERLSDAKCEKIKEPLTPFPRCPEGKYCIELAVR